MWFSLVSFRSSWPRRSTHTLFLFIRPRYIIIDVPASWSGVFCRESLHHHFQVARIHSTSKGVSPDFKRWKSLVHRFSTRGGRKSSVFTKRLVKQQTQAEEEGVEPWLLGLTAMLHCRGILSWNRGQHLNFLKSTGSLFAKVTSHEMRGIVTCLEILNYIGIGWKIFRDKDIDNYVRMVVIYFKLLFFSLLLFQKYLSKFD